MGDDGYMGKTIVLAVILLILTVAVFVEHHVPGVPLDVCWASIKQSASEAPPVPLDKRFIVLIIVAIAPALAFYIGAFFSSRKDRMENKTNEINKLPMETDCKENNGSLKEARDIPLTILHKASLMAISRQPLRRRAAANEVIQRHVEVVG